MAYRKSKQRTKALARSRKDEERRAAALIENPELWTIEHQLEMLGRITEDYDASTDQGSFLESKLNSLIVQFRELAGNYDPARVIGVMRMLSFANARIQGSHQRLNEGRDYSISLVEAATLVLYCGAHVSDADSFPEPAIGKGGLDEAAEKFFEIMRQIRLVVTAFQLNKTGQMSSQAQIAARHSAVRQWIRESTYSSVLMEINHDLFSAASIDELLTDNRSYSFGDVERVFGWLAYSADDRLNNAADQLLELFNQRFQLSGKDAERVMRALARMFAPPFEDVTLSAREVAQSTGQPEPVVQKILEDFSINLSELPEQHVGMMLVEGSSPLFEFPLVRERENRFLIPDEALLAPSIKRNLETTLLTAKASQNVYSNHRSRFLETRLSTVLERFLPHAKLLKNLSFVLWITKEEKPTLFCCLETSPLSSKQKQVPFLNLVKLSQYQSFEIVCIKIFLRRPSRLRRCAMLLRKIGAFHWNVDSRLIYPKYGRFIQSL